jgi:hypothetical protein
MYDSSLPPVLPLVTTQKQSKIGIASFVLGILSLLFLCIGLIISISYGVTLGLNNPYATDPYALVDQASPAILAASIFIYCAPVISLVGVGLGIAAAVQKKDKKTLGIVGLVINALLLLGVCLMIILGLVMATGAAGI